MDYDNEKTGALFKNLKATVENKQPQYRGSLTLNGVEYNVSSWIKTSKKGTKYMSLKLQDKDDAPSPAASSVADDDAPF